MNIFPVKAAGILYIIYGVLSFFVLVDAWYTSLTDFAQSFESVQLIILLLPLTLIFLGGGILKKEISVIIVALLVLPLVWLFLGLLQWGATPPDIPYVIELALIPIIPGLAFILAVWSIFILKKRTAKVN